MAKPILTLQERFGGQSTTNKLLISKAQNSIRVAIPGIITAFDTSTQTVTVKPAIMEQVRDEEGKVDSVELPELLDVPLVFPRSGGYSLTMPITIGDECLVIFADMCIDAWWASGGVQKQEEIRRHDLSDAFAILGTWSQVRKVKNYNLTKAKLVHEQTGTGIEIDGTTGIVNVVGTLKVNGTTVNVP